MNGRRLRGRDTGMESSQGSAESPSAMTVSELTGHLKAVVEGTFPPMWVSGEISDLARPRSGHLYFTLKDENAQIRGVVWRSVAERIPFEIEDGQSVLCFGGLEVYAARGSYQIVVRKMQPQGVGALQLAFEQLRARLHAEGIFDPDRKRSLPDFPARVGVITSATGAALRDFLEAAHARYRGTEILVIPAVVQGANAKASILRGLRDGNAIRPALDALVLTRGGGSLEDLWCFNEEAVVRGVANSSVPVVSAIGHEIDVTLCDLAADVRALTPTDAATLVLPSGERLAAAFDGWTTRLVQAMRSVIRERRLRLRAVAERPILKSPLEFIHHRSRLLDDLDQRARQAVFRRVSDETVRLQSLSRSLHALSPLNVLGRGYSVTYGPDGEPVKSTDEVQSGDRLKTRLANGEINSVAE
ncbi:MAG: exodeoxyribonuclease VII large subunit [Planctomycetota bacterium]